MYRFENDYSQGCIPEILEIFTRTNMEQTPGYRLDPYCKAASEKIARACGKDDLDVHFLVGGTQANFTVLDAILRPHQGVVAAQLGHVNVHEAGAVEGVGHKVLAISNGDVKKDDESKIYPDILDDYLTKFFAKGDWHMVQPGAVYISHPTERGVLYTREELIAIKSICEKHNLPLYLDGARLSYALASENNDISLEDLAKYTDIFYIGGTKCGAMFGEAVCFTNSKYNLDFNCITKHNGGVLAKGRLLGIQFDYLFTDNNYIEKSRNAVKYAIMIKKALEDRGISFIVDSYTNQQFPILSYFQKEILDKNNITYNVESNVDENNDCIRLCTSWGTKKEDIDYLIDVINKL